MYEFKFNHKKVGYTCSWLSILTQLAPLVPDDAKVNFYLINNYSSLKIVFYFLFKI